MTGDVALSLLVLWSAGLVPSVTVCGPRPVTVFAAPLAGSVVAAAAAVGCLAVGGGIAGWFVAVAAVAGGLCVLWWVARPGARPWRRLPAEWSWGEAAALVPVVAVAAWSLRGLSVVDIGFDTRGLWLLHAAWFAEGHATARAALSDRTLFFSHASYPPLVGASVATGWSATGLVPGSPAALRDGQVVVGLLNGCALVVLGSVVVAAGRGMRVIGAVVAAVLVLAVAGAIGPVLVDGYADALWVLAAAGAVGYGLVIGPAAGRLGMAGLLVAVAGSTKLEGIVTAALVVVLVALRYLVTGSTADGDGDGDDRRRTSWAAYIAGAVAALAALVAWPVLTAALHAYPDVDTSGPRVGTVSSRLDASLHAMWPHLHLVPAAAVVAVLGSLVLARRRRSLDLAGDGWLWVVLAWNLIVVLATYGLGSVAVDAWLATSVVRTTIFAPVLACTSMATWAVVAASALADRPQGRSPPDAAEPPLDDRDRGVLHHVP